MRLGRWVPPGRKSGDWHAIAMGDVIDFEEYRKRRTEGDADPTGRRSGPARRRSQNEANKSLPKPEQEPESDPGDRTVD